MTAQELSQLKGLLAQGGPDFSDEPAAVRAMFEGMLATFPVDESFQFEQRTIGGVSGLWLESTDTDAPVLLYLHGGAYVIGSANSYRGLAGGLARAGGSSLFSIDYRLAPESAFPAAVDDAVAAYRGLLEAGYDSSRIAVAGDSAGGGLALALLISLKADGIPQPACAVTLSPWTDLTFTGASLATKAEVDKSLDEPGLRVSADRYLAGGDPAADRVSPVFADLSGLPPLLIEVGSGEILLDDSTRLAAKAGADAVDVTLHIWPEMVHDWSLFAFMLSEGRDMIDEVGAFIKRYVGGK